MFNQRSLEVSQVKKIWVNLIPWNEKLARAAIESGAEALLVAKADTAKVKKIAGIKTISEDGDIVPGKDVEILEIKSKADEVKASGIPGDKMLILRMKDWTIIPLENLIARRGNLIVEVSSGEEAKLMTGILEKGVDGVLFNIRDSEMLRKGIKLVRELSHPISLVRARIKKIKALGLGDRACIDTCTMMKPGQGMLVGNTGGGFFLVHAEVSENPYVESRPFRVNAGSLHAYILVPQAKTRYLSELRAGDEVMVVDREGRTETAFIGRVKVEKRPMLLVEAGTEGKDISLILQNAETIVLTKPDGNPVSVTSLKQGDEVLAYLEEGGRHFGMKVEETIIER
jgi:3-dehydroquinate synthase II